MSITLFKSYQGVYYPNVCTYQIALHMQCCLNFKLYFANLHELPCKILGMNICILQARNQETEGLNELPYDDEEAGLCQISRHRLLINNSFSQVILLLDCSSTYQQFNLFPHKYFQIQIFFMDCCIFVLSNLNEKTPRVLFRKCNVIYGKIVLNYNAAFPDNINDSLESKGELLCLPKISLEKSSVF